MRSSHYNGHTERQRRERDTPERILAIARKNGSFDVSLRYRDDWLRKRCADLRKQGLLTGGRKIVHGRITFYPVGVAPIPVISLADIPALAAEPDHSRA